MLESLLNEVAGLGKKNQLRWLLLPLTTTIGGCDFCLIIKKVVMIDRRIAREKK